MEKFIEEARKHVARSIGVDYNDTFSVWSCWIAGNKKALIGAHGSRYYVEVTYIEKENKTIYDLYLKYRKEEVKDK